MEPRKDIRLIQNDVEMASAASDKNLVEKQQDATVERQALSETELEHARDQSCYSRTGGETGSSRDLSSRE